MTDLTELAEVHPRALSYYERADLDHALALALEKIDEWEYEADAHGYCHERPTLVRLVKALADLGVPLPATAYREATR